ncbi:MAG: MFS transporter [Niastella sp.]|nr:MFS transporter [Niastella sp.]
MQQAIGKYRWTICGLLFFATTVNYLDRQVLSLLQPRLESMFNWTSSDYANITAVFQFTYAIFMLFAGRIIDKLGTKKGYAWAIVIWSIGAIIHSQAEPIGKAVGALVGAAGAFTVIGFMVCRAVLALGEAGNFPAAIKATAEYFPKKERSLATGIFNSGANVGAILAPLTVPWIADHWGWGAAFEIIGAVGFLWLIFWWLFYEKPEKQKRLSQAELEYIRSDKEDAPAQTATAQSEKVSWFKLLTYRQTWAFAIGKFSTDGIWWFFLFWLPAYLKAQYGMVGESIQFPLAICYTFAMIGSIMGGWFPMYFIKKGYAAYDGRMRAMLLIAVFPLVVLAAQPLGYISFWVPVFFIGIGTAAHQAWSANIFTTVSDMFPKKAVGSVVGIGGMAGGLGGVLVTKIGGWLFDAYTATGITRSWADAKAAGLGEFVDKVQAMNLLTKAGDKVNIQAKALSNISKDVVEQIKAIDPAAFDKFLQIQKPLVQAEMTTAYTIMFTICALAYLFAWIIMKSLVPKYKPITDL